MIKASLAFISNFFSHNHVYFRYSLHNKNQLHLYCSNMIKALELLGLKDNFQLLDEDDVPSKDNCVVFDFTMPKWNTSDRNYYVCLPLTFTPRPDTSYCKLLGEASVLIFNDGGYLNFLKNTTTNISTAFLPIPFFAFESTSYRAVELINVTHNFIGRKIPSKSTIFGIVVTDLNQSGLKQLIYAYLNAFVSTDPVQLTLCFFLNQVDNAITKVCHNSIRSIVSEFSVDNPPKIFVAFEILSNTKICHFISSIDILLTNSKWDPLGILPQYSCFFNKIIVMPKYRSIFQWQTHECMRLYDSYLDIDPKLQQLPFHKDCKVFKAILSSLIYQLRKVHEENIKLTEPTKANQLQLEQSIQRNKLEWVDSFEKLLISVNINQ